MKLLRAAGIDLGTTNSAIAMMAPEGNDIWLFEDRFRRKTFPSVVGWDPGKNRYVTGWEAWNRRGMDPQPISSIKRKMGRQEPVEVGPNRLRPEEISAKILSELARAFEPFVRERIEDYEVAVKSAVITVPAYFDAPQIEATRRAGELAGLEVLSLVQEPTAAAMYYAWKHGIGDGTFLVYDLGGGTFDVSIIRSLMGEYQVVGIDGDNYLGGDDFDRRLAEHFRRHLVDQGYALDLDIAHDADDATRFLLLTRVAQEVKEALSTSDFQYVGRRDIFQDQEGQPVTLELEISREQFEEMIDDLVDQTIERCHSALARATEQADVTLEDVDYVLLVGGSTRVPLVRARVEEKLCAGTQAGVALQDEPDTCVALGAAIHAANLAGLTLVDETHDARLAVSSPLYTHRNEGRLVGRLSGRADALDRTESVALLNQAGDIAALARPQNEDEALVFEIDDIGLPDPGRYEFSLEFCDAEGEAVLRFDVPMYRGTPAEGYRPTGSALSNPAVLAKDIYLEVVREGKSERQVLLRRGSTLPAEGNFRFFTADRSGAVLLRLFQNRFPIRTIHLQVPEQTEVGTPVDLNLQIDESMAMVASGEVVGQKFWAQIEPPPAREVKEWQEIEALLDQVEHVERTLWGYEARHFQSLTTPLVAGIRETARTDPDKLQALVVRLEDVLEDYHARDAELTPGWGRFVALLDAIKRVVYRGDSRRQLGMGTEEWRAKIEQIEQDAEQAYEAKDQPAWSNAFNQVQAIWESIAQDEFRFTASNTSEQLARIAQTLVHEVEELRSLLQNFNFSRNPETEALQRREVSRLSAELETRVEKPLSQLDIASLPPAHAKPQLDRLYEAAMHVRKQYEKLPTLGLVSR